jgi:hypothetical protein
LRFSFGFVVVAVAVSIIPTCLHRRCRMTVEAILLPRRRLRCIRGSLAPGSLAGKMIASRSVWFVRSYIYFSGLVSRARQSSDCATTGPSEQQGPYARNFRIRPSRAAWNSQLAGSRFTKRSMRRFGILAAAWRGLAPSPRALQIRYCFPALNKSVITLTPASQAWLRHGSPNAPSIDFKSEKLV